MRSFFGQTRRDGDAHGIYVRPIAQDAMTRGREKSEFIGTYSVTTATLSADCALGLGPTEGPDVSETRNVGSFSTRAQKEEEGGCGASRAHGRGQVQGGLKAGLRRGVSAVVERGVNESRNFFEERAKFAEAHAAYSAAQVLLQAKFAEAQVLLQAKFAEAHAAYSDAQALIQGSISNWLTIFLQVILRHPHAFGCIRLRDVVRMACTCKTWKFAIDAALPRGRRKLAGEYGRLVFTVLADNPINSVFAPKPPAENATPASELEETPKQITVAKTEAALKNLCDGTISFPIKAPGGAEVSFKDLLVAFEHCGLLFGDGDSSDDIYEQVANVVEKVNADDNQQVIIYLPWTLYGGDHAPFFDGGDHAPFFDQFHSVLDVSDDLRTALKDVAGGHDDDDDDDDWFGLLQVRLRSRGRE